MALVTVLAIVVLLAAIAVSMSVAMRTERVAAGHFSSGVSAEVFAKEGVETVRAKILEATDPARDWSSGPGWITSWKDPTATSGTPFADPKTTELSSGEETGTDGFDLNRVVLSADERTAVRGNTTTSEMRVRWIYVYNDGKRTYDPPTKPEDGVVGRYAFWTDNESSRINLNTAWQRTGNTNSSSSPSRITLEGAIPGLTTFDARAIFDAAATNPFATPDEARVRNANLAALLSESRFLTTHASWNDDLNPWGDPKIVLTTDPKLAAGRPYLDIVGGNLTKTVNTLATQLNRKLPFTTSTDGFGKKFSDGGPDLAAALAVDIIDYVRSAEEASTSIVYPTRGSIENGLFSTSNNTGVNGMIGVARHPLITELGLWIGGTETPPKPPALATHEGRIVVEIHSPIGFKLPPIPIEEFSAQILIERKSGGQGELVFKTSPNVDIISPANGILQPGGYAVVALRFTVDMSAPTRAAATERGVRVALRWKKGGGGGGGVIAAAPIYFGSDSEIAARWIIAPVNPVSEPYAPSTVRSLEISDPRVGSHRDDWLLRGAGNTFGAENSNWASGQVEVSTPPRDGDGAEAALLMPPPKATAANLFGAIQSVAELGVISTGRFGANLKSVPWRTVRLRPTPGSSLATLPDWALTDLFVAPIVAPNGGSPAEKVLAQYQPRPLVTAGRINVNGPIKPFTTLTRPEPFRALLTGISGLPVESAVTALQARTLAPDGILLNPSGETLISPGELTQIEGLGAKDEQGELRMRQVLDLATTRGNTFRVYSTGQSIKCLKSGQIVIQSERSALAILQRDDDSCRVIHWSTIPF